MTTNTIFEAIKKEYKGGGLGKYAKKYGLDASEWRSWKTKNPVRYKDLKQYKDSLEWIDRDELIKALDRFNWSRNKTAKALNLHPRIVYKIVSKWELSEEDLFYNKHKHEIGRASGDLVVTGVRSSYYPNGRPVLFFECECSCGKKTDIRQGNFNSGASTHCDECRRRYATAKMQELGRRSKGRTKKPVRCVETGQVFPSMVNAAKSLGGESSVPIRRHLHGHQKNAFGYTWEEA